MDFQIGKNPGIPNFDGRKAGGSIFKQEKRPASMALGPGDIGGQCPPFCGGFQKFLKDSKRLALNLAMGRFFGPGAYVGCRAKWVFLEPQRFFYGSWIGVVTNAVITFTKNWAGNLLTLLNSYFPLSVVVL